MSCDWSVLYSVRFLFAVSRLAQFDGHKPVVFGHTRKVKILQLLQEEDHCRSVIRHTLNWVAVKSQSSQIRHFYQFLYFIQTPYLISVEVEGTNIGKLNDCVVDFVKFVEAEINRL